MRTATVSKSLCIEESRIFFRNVLVDCIKEVGKDKMLKPADRTALHKLRGRWLTKYKPQIRMPALATPPAEKKDSTTSTQPLDKRRRTIKLLKELPSKPNKCITKRSSRRSTTNNRSKPNQKKTTSNLCTDTESEDDLEELSDNEMVQMEIRAPPLKPEWKCRLFRVTVPARFAKDEMITPLLNWEFMCTIMEKPEAEAMTFFQKSVNNILLDNNSNELAVVDLTN